MVTVTADGLGDVLESLEGNNVSTGIFGADLIVDSISISPTMPRVGEPFEVTVEITNTGSMGAAPSVTSIRIGNSTQTFNVPIIGPGATETVTRTATFNVAQTYVVRTEADVNDDNRELRESNNALQQAVTITH